MLVIRLLIVIVAIFLTINLVNHQLTIAQEQEQNDQDSSEQDQQERDSQQSSTENSDTEDLDGSIDLTINDIEEQTFKAYKFSLLDDEDPFVPNVQITDFELEVESSQSSQNIIGYVEELQRFPISDLLLSGVWETDGEFKALVITPDNKGHIVSVGDYLGVDSGKILAITKKGIKIRKISYDSDLNRQIVDQYLAMNELNDTKLLEKNKSQLNDEMISLNPE